MVEDHIKTIAKGAGIFFIGVMISKFFGYFYRLVVARGLGPEAYGIFSLCYAIVSVVTTLAIFGLPNAIERYVPHYFENKSKVKGIILFTLQVGFATSLVATVLLYLFSRNLTGAFRSSALLVPLQIFLLSITPLAILTIYEGICRAFKKVEYTTYSHNIFYAIVNIIAALIVIKLGLGIVGIAYGFVIANVAAFCMIFFLVERNIFSLFDKVKTVFMRKELFSFSWPLSLAGIFGLLIGWIDTILIGYFMNEKYVGLYNAAIPTVNLLLVIPLAVVSLFIPVTAKLLAKNKIMELKKSYFISSEWIFFINFPIFLILFVFPQQVLNVLFGAVYSATAQALSILAIGFFMYASAHPSLKMLELQKDTKFYLISTGLAALTNILLNLWLIPLYGLNGAAVASAVSLIMLFILVTYKVNQRGNYLTYSNGFMKSGFIAMALLGVIYIFAKIFFSIITPIMLIPLTCIYLGSYALLLFLFVLRTEEKEIISKIVTKVRNILRVS